MSAAFLLRSLRCLQSSPQNSEVLETLAGPSRRPQTQTETFRPSPGTACRIHGSVALRFHATSPAEGTRKRDNHKDAALIMRMPTSCMWLSYGITSVSTDRLMLCELAFLALDAGVCNQGKDNTETQIKHLRLKMQNVLTRVDRQQWQTSI